jgi:LysM repeat protein
MRTWKSLVLTLTFAVAAVAPATASASFQHIVAKGETLSSVATADGLSISQLAAANAMSPDSQLISGSSLVIPPQDVSAGESAVSSPATSAGTSTAAAPDSSGGGFVVQRGDTLSAIAGRLGVTVNALAAANGLDPSHLLIAGTTLHGAADAGSSGSAESNAAPAESTGGLVVQRGDTLSAIAAHMGVTVDALAAANGLDPSGLLISGTTLHALGGASSGAAPATTEMVSTSPASGGGAEPTPEMVSPATVGSIAASEGVPASLAEAVGYQESGFNNGMVSNTGAVGVMQIMPSTWSWIGQHLAGPPPLSTASATDNIRAGSLLLHSLLSDAGGNAETAIAGYYQGLGSVQAHGMYADTRAYVNNVMALQQRFGGG